MTLTRFVSSSLLVSGTFALLAYTVLSSPFLGSEGASHYLATKSLGLLPYLLGALLNKEGYWTRTARWDDHAAHEKKWFRSRLAIRLLRTVAAVAAVGVAVAIYRTWGPEILRGVLLVLIGVVWGSVVTRAWFIWREETASSSKE